MKLESSYGRPPCRGIEDPGLPVENVLAAQQVKNRAIRGRSNVLASWMAARISSSVISRIRLPSFSSPDC